MEMKLVVMIVDESKKEELEVVLRRSGVAGYTELPGAVGVGATGPRLGSRAFPKTSAVIFSVLSEPALTQLRQEIREHCTECGERLKLLVWDVDEVAL